MYTVHFSKTFQYRKPKLTASIIFTGLLFIGINSYGGIITSAATGNWGTGATWVGGVAPLSTDDVIIANGHTVSLTAASLITNLTINSGGTLSDGGKRLTASGNFVINGTYAGTGGANSRLLFTGISLKNITVTDGTSAWVNALDATLNVSESLMPTGTLTATAAGNIVNYNGPWRKL